MFKIFVSDGVQDAFLKAEFNTIEACMRGLEFIKPDLIEMGWQAICLYQ